MDVPVKYTDITKKSNIWWLVRNLETTNKENPQIKEVLNLLKERLINYDQD